MMLSVSPVKISACSFRGDSEKPEHKYEVKDVSGRVKAVTDEFKETTDVLADGAKTVTESVGTLGTSALGLWALAKKPFVGIYNYFVPAVIKDGKPVLKDVLDEKTGEVVQKIVRQANWKRIGIAGGVAAAGVALLAIASKIKNDKAAKTEESKTEAVKVETEEV